MEYHDELNQVRQDEAANLQPKPFRPRREISADARYIVTHLWIIFVVLPFVLAILYKILR